VRLSDPNGNVATFDRAATVEAYNALLGGSTDGCECVYCANYRLYRERRLFPRALLDVCESLGIDITKEGEITHDGLNAIGNSTCTGEMDFVGTVSIHTHTSEGVPVSDLRPEGWAFARNGGPTPPSVFGKEVGVVAFSLELPWLLEEQPD
jgi:hypothetical protein